MARLTQLTNTRSMVDSNGVMTQEARLYFQQLTDLIPISGSGSPEGAINAVQGATYYDLDAAQGQRHYIKIQADINGDSTQGWELA